jgi:hypothetical protein
MSKKNGGLDFTTKEPLIDRQRRLLVQAESIEIAMQSEKPLPNNVSEWLQRALRKIACGEDANEVFDVIGVKTERKDALKAELFHKHTVGFIVSKTQQGTNKSTATNAIEMLSAAIPEKKKSTIRKNYNKLSTERKLTYSLSKK